MDTAANPVPDSRNLRRRRNPRNIQNAQIRRRSPVIAQEEEDAMKDHRLFHKRAPQAVEVVTVDVVATVDDNGNVIAATTLQPGQPAPTTQAADAPAAAPAQAQPASPAPPPAVVPVVQDAVPTVAEAPIVVAAASDIPAVTAIVNSIPVVPSVPPFPTDLVVPSVPAFPFASPATPAEVPASTAAPAPATSAAAAPPDAASNSTMTSTSLASATDLSSSDNASRTGSASLSTHLSSHTTTASNARSSATDSSAVFTATQSVSGGVLGVPGAPGATNSPIADATTNKSPTPLETPQVVGSVVGSLAGAALILAIILLLLRRHKRRRGGALQLTGDDRSDHNHQPMAAKSAPLAFVPNAFLNRFSSMSRSTVESNTSGGEKSFQRLHGRKLPSAWSEGMTSDQFSRGGGTLSGSSFYQDDQGTYGGPGLPKDFEKEIGGVSNTRASGPMNFRPSPARTPVIRNPDDPSFWGRGNTHLSPPQSPNRDAQPRGTLGRSLPSQDGSRSSRFTENV